MSSPFCGDECRESFAYCGVHLSGCLAGDGRFKKKKDGYHQKVNKTTDCDAFQYIPIDHIDERLVYLWGAGFGRGVVMMA